MVIFFPEDTIGILRYFFGKVIEYLVELFQILTKVQMVEEYQLVGKLIFFIIFLEHLFNQGYCPFCGIRDIVAVYCQYEEAGGRIEQHTLSKIIRPEAVEQLFHVLVMQSERYKDVLMPGYTHLQIAMPSSFGLWFGAYAESLVDDMLFLQAAFKMCNRNPLGSAAGYGSSFPLNRTMTTRLLGFDSLNYNVVYAQMGRGKMERNVAFALASIAGTVSKLAFDACMFNSQNFGFIKLPDQFTTGSSIMPHKKNPDVFELTRAKCNKLQGLPQQITLISNNLPSGYFRDLQIIKEVFLPSFDELKDCLRMVTHMMREVKVNEQILDDDKYALLFSVEEVNRLVLEGMPFRDAYKQGGLNIEAGKFVPVKKVHHTHEGSIGNLCNDQISALMQNIMDGFAFNRVNEAEQQLLS